MSPKQRVVDLWPEAACKPAQVNGRRCYMVTIKSGRYAYGTTPACAWREAAEMVLYTRELREGAAARPGKGDT